MIAPLAALLRLHEMETGAENGTSTEKISNKDRLLQSLDEEMIEIYQKLALQYGVTAVTTVEKNSCMGCYMRQPSHKEELAEDIYRCHNCGRFLYEPDAAYELSVG